MRTSRQAIRGSTAVSIATTVGALLLVVLVVLAGLSMVRTSTPERPPVMICQSYLRHIAQLALLYADSGHGFLPFSNEGGPASLQVLVDFDQDLDPGWFLCRSDVARHAATRAPDGRYRLTRDNCSYEYAPVRLTPDDDAPLAWCRSPFHKGGRNVVNVDTSVRYMTEDEFQEELAKLEKFHSR